MIVNMCLLQFRSNSQWAEPFLGKVIIRKNDSPQSLWEVRTLTSLTASNKHSRPSHIYTRQPFVLFHFSDSTEPLQSPFLVLLLKVQIASAQIAMELSSFLYSQE